MLHNTQFLLNAVILFKRKYSFQFALFICSFNSQKPLNYSTFDQLDFVKTQQFNNNDVIVTSYDIISLLIRWKLNKFGMNCKLSKYLVNSFNCKKLALSNTISNVSQFNLFFNFTCLYVF